MWKLCAVREGRTGIPDGRHYAGKGIGWECRDGLVNVKGALLEKSPQDIPLR